jgi:hypothetical protein
MEKEMKKAMMTIKVRGWEEGWIRKRGRRVVRAQKKFEKRGGSKSRIIA